MTTSTEGTPALGLEDALGSVRDQFIVAFLRAIRQAHAAGIAVEPEPIRMASEGSIGRSGLLSLPSRGESDLDDIGDGILTIEPLTALHHETYHYIINKTLSCDILPFVWNDVWISTAPTCSSALLMRLRLWYLDWFQSRIVDADEALSGALHRLDGPHEHDGAHWFHLDLGTAPVDSLTSLLDLLAAAEIRICTIGGRPGFG